MRAQGARVARVITPEDRALWVALGGRVRVVREERGWTQDQLARLIGSDRNSVNRWERGRGAPSLYALERLGAVCQVTCDWLLRGEARDVAHDALEAWLASPRGQLAGVDAQRWMRAIPIAHRSPPPRYFDALLVAYEAGVTDPAQAAASAALAAARSGDRG